MQEGRVALSKSFVSGGDAPKMFDPCEETLDQIAVLVQMRIVESEFLAIGTRRDDRLGTTGLDPLDQGIGVVALVGDNRIGPDVYNQIGGALDIGDLIRTQNQPQWIAQSVHCSVDFGAQSASRAPDRFRAFFWLHQRNAGGHGGHGDCGAGPAYCAGRSPGLDRGDENGNHAVRRA